MKGKKICLTQIVGSLVMITSLLWLSVSTPFIYSAQVQTEKQIHGGTNTGDNKDNPLTNINEEKTENSITLSEYLHEGINVEQLSVFISNNFKSYPFGIYFAFHPELLSPPPEA